MPVPENGREDAMEVPRIQDRWKIIVYSQIVRDTGGTVSSGAEVQVPQWSTMEQHVSRCRRLDDLGHWKIFVRTCCNILKMVFLALVLDTKTRTNA
jgi:hypothetical protein